MFNVGDVVVCVSSMNQCITVGKEYIITKTVEEYSYLISNMGYEQGFYHHRFNLVKQAALVKAKRIAKPKREPGKFLVGDSIIVNSNNDNGKFFPDETYDEHIGKMLIVTRVSDFDKTYQRVYCEAVSCGWLDSRQIQLALRKDGKPRKLRKPAAPKIPKNLRWELDKRCEAAPPSCCHYVVHYSNEVEWSVPAACYASLNYEENLNRDIKAVWENLSNHHKHHPHKPAYERFVDYILNRSVFKDGFKKSKASRPWLTSIEWNIEKGRSFVVTCALALREGSEYPEQLIVWDELVTKGYSEDLAWFLAGFITKTGKKYGLKKVSMHSCRHYQMSFKEVFSIIQVGLPEYVQEPMKNKGNGKYIIHTNLVKTHYHVVPVEEQIYTVFYNKIETKETGYGWHKAVEMKFEDICVFADELAAELKESK